MTILIRICIAIDVLVAIFLGGTLLNPDQDAAGKGMIGLPVILLLICAGCAWLLTNLHYRLVALLISALPAMTAVYVTYLTIKKS